MNRSAGFCLLLLLLSGFVCLIHTGCANIIPPGGGPKDSLPPVLLAATPRDSTRNFKAKQITLTFDEYVTLDNIQENLIVSPNPKNIPEITSRLRNVTVKLKDSLEPNTTYAINFGNAVKDVNEGNIAKQFTYVFSTGNTIDSGSLSGVVQLAANGKFDSTLIVVLHNNLADSAIRKLPPRYYARVNSRGQFRFTNLPPGRFNVFALPNDYGKKYDDSTKVFAFLDSTVTIGQTQPLLLHAFQEFVEKPRVSRNTAEQPKKGKNTEDKRLRMNTSLAGGDQDLLGAIELVFGRKLARFDSSRIQLTDTNYVAVKDVHFTLDTGLTRITIRHPWPEDTRFKLVIQKEAFADSAGNTLLKADTLNFKTKKESEYGSLRLRFPSLDLSKNPVLQLIQSDKAIDSIPIRQKELYWKLYNPGDYELRILYDRDKNGTWSPGHFWEGPKTQPEIVVPAQPQKITVRPNWDNEWDVSALPPGEAAEDPAKRAAPARPGR
jgi:hypothetical protein